MTPRSERSWFPIERWGLVELGAIVGPDGMPNAIGFRFGDVNPPDYWVAEAILRNLGLHLCIRFLRAREVKPDGPRRPIHSRALRKWIAETRRLADDVGYVWGDVSANQMRDVASRAVGMSHGAYQE